MTSVSSPLARSATRVMWRGTWEESLLPGSLYRFLGFLCRFLTHGGRFDWTGVKVLIQQYGQANGRRAYSLAWIEKLLRRAVDAGLIRRARHSAPGRPAVYEAVIPDHPGYREIRIRRRGIRPRHLLASWRNEHTTPLFRDHVGPVGVEQFFPAALAEDGDHGDPLRDLQHLTFGSGRHPRRHYIIRPGDDPGPWWRDKRERPGSPPGHY